jgi:hypothetical protein
LVDERTLLDYGIMGPETLKLSWTEQGQLDAEMFEDFGSSDENVE